MAQRTSTESFLEQYLFIDPGKIKISLSLSSWT